jgi:hypothetical protein
LRLTFRDRIEAGIPAGAQVQGFCALIQGHHLFIPLLDVALPHYLAAIVSRDGAVGVANLDAHAHDTDVRAAKGEHVSLNRKDGPIIRGAVARDNSQGTLFGGAGLVISLLNGGAALTGKGGRKTPNACDMSARETNIDAAAQSGYRMRLNSSGRSDLPGLLWILGLRQTRCHRNNSAIAFACY